VQTKAKIAVNLLPLGETAIFVEFGKEIKPEIHYKIKSFTDYLEAHPFPGLVEYVAAFCSVAVYYDPLKVKTMGLADTTGQDVSVYETVAALVRKILDKLEYSTDPAPRIVKIPVCYGGEFGPDLDYVAKYNNLTAQEVIEIHTGGQYLVYMIGFAPGFPYLGGMSEKIATPRRETPRMSIPAGAVGIAGMQTGVYPISTPGGWQLIGRTPVALFCPDKNPPTLLQAGDSIRFYPISPAEYAAYGEGNP